MKTNSATPSEILPLPAADGADVPTLQAALTAAESRNREMEAELRLYKALADIMPQIVWTANPDGHIDYYNQRWYEYTGFTREATLAPEGWKPVLHPDDLARCERAWYGAVASGEAYEIEYRFLRASDHTYRWHLGRALSLRDEQGHILKWFGTCTDIDDQKAKGERERVFNELDTRLRRSEERLRFAISGADIGTWHWDLQTDVLEWSDHCKAIFGLTPDTAMSYELFLSILHPDDRELTQQAVHHTLREGEDYNITYRAVLSDGQTRWINARGRAYFDSAGKPFHFEGIVQDIDAHKQHEEQIERLNRRLQIAMSETHHRVKNNLQVITSLVDMQSMRAEEEQADHRWQEFKRLGMQVRTLSLVHEMLTQQFQHEERWHTLSARVMLQQLGSLLQQTPTFRRLVLRCDDVMLEAKRVTALLMIASDLCFHAAQRGANRFQLDFKIARNQARLRVEDNGPPYPDGFDPFREDNPVLEFIESLTRTDLQGRVCYDAEADSGCIFIEFPLPPV